MKKCETGCMFTQKEATFWFTGFLYHFEMLTRPFSLQTRARFCLALFDATVYLHQMSRHAQVTSLYWLD